MPKNMEDLLKMGDDLEAKAAAKKESAAAAAPAKKETPPVVSEALAPYFDKAVGREADNIRSHIQLYLDLVAEREAKKKEVGGTKEWTALGKEVKKIVDNMPLLLQDLLKSRFGDNMKLVETGTSIAGDFLTKLAAGKLGDLDGIMKDFIMKDRTLFVETKNKALAIERQEKSAKARNKMVEVRARIAEEVEAKERRGAYDKKISALQKETEIIGAQVEKLTTLPDIMRVLAKTPEIVNKDGRIYKTADLVKIIETLDKVKEITSGTPILGFLTQAAGLRQRVFEILQKREAKPTEKEEQKAAKKEVTTDYKLLKNILDGKIPRGEWVAWKANEYTTDKSGRVRVRDIGTGGGSTYLSKADRDQLMLELGNIEVLKRDEKELKTPVSKERSFDLEEINEILSRNPGMTYEEAEKRAGRIDRDYVKGLKGYSEAVVAAREDLKKQEEARDRADWNRPSADEYAAKVIEFNNKVAGSGDYRSLMQNIRAMDRLPGPKGFFIDSEEVIAQFRAIQFERKPAEREKLIKNLPTTELRAVAMNVERKGQELMADAKREKTIDKAVDAGVERSGRDKQLEMEFKRLKVEMAAKEGEICGILELQPAERKDFLSRMNRNGFEFVVSSYDFDFHRDLISDDGRKALKKAIREHEQLEKELKRVDVSGVGRQEFTEEVTKESEVGMPDAKTLKLYTPEALKAKIEKMFYVNVETPSKEEERTIENLKKGNIDFVTLLEAYKQATFEEANAAGLQTEETKAAYAETLKKADQGAKEKEETTAAQAAPKSFWQRVGGFFSRK